MQILLIAIMFFIIFLTYYFLYNSPAAINENNNTFINNTNYNSISSYQFPRMDDKYLNFYLSAAHDRRGVVKGDGDDDDDLTYKNITISNILNAFYKCDHIDCDCLRL